MSKLPAQKTSKAIEDDNEDDEVELTMTSPLKDEPLPKGMFNSVAKPKADPSLVEAILKKPDFKGKLVEGQQVPLHAANIQSRDTQRDADERRKKAVQAAVDAALK